MSSTLSRVFRSVGNAPQNFSPNSNVSAISKPYPMLNVVSDSLSNYFFTQTQTRKKKWLMQWYSSIPELTGMVNKVARDICGDFHFEPINPDEVGKTGRNKIFKANKFCAEIGYKKQKLMQIIDRLVTGESFAWKGKISDKQIKDTITKHLNFRPFVEQKVKTALSAHIFHELKATEGFGGSGFDEDFLMPRKYRTVASTTMEIVHDTFDVIGFRQIVAGKHKPFDLKEIIHSTFGQIDGKVSGFTPVESIVVQLELLRFMWQNMLAYERNGGGPDRMFVLKNIRPGDPAYARMKNQLEKYKLVQNKHGDLLFTGDVSVENLEQLDKMQFKDMGLYIMGIMALQWELPKSSLPMVIGGTNTKDDTGGNSERGYWDNIEFSQEMDSETENSQLWIPHFGVKLVYDRKFVQKDIQKETALQLQLGNLITTDSLLATNGVQLNKKKKLRMLGLTEMDLEKKPEEIEVDPKTNLNNQLSKNEVNDSSDKANLRKKKREEEEQSNRSIGDSDGVSKELDKNAMVEFKQMIGSDSESVDLKTFVQIYNQDKAYQDGMPPRLFLKENSDFVSYKFKSTDFVYRTVINRLDLDSDEVRISLMNLQTDRNVYRV